MTRNCVILTCSLVGLIVLASPACGQGVPGPGMLGTPPAEGHTIQEVATAEVTGTLSDLWVNGETVTVVGIALPLPVFESSGETAGPSQCMWTFHPYEWAWDPAAVASVGCTGVSYRLQVDGSTLLLGMEAALADPLHELVIGVTYRITAIAFRTSSPAPVESKSFGEIKAMFRD